MFVFTSFSFVQLHTHVNKTLGWSDPVVSEGEKLLPVAMATQDHRQVMPWSPFTLWRQDGLRLHTHPAQLSVSEEPGKFTVVGPVPTKSGAGVGVVAGASGQQTGEGPPVTQFAFLQSR